MRIGTQPPTVWTPPLRQPHADTPSAPVPPTMSFHVARAYGLRATAPARGTPALTHPEAVQGAGSTSGAGAAKANAAITLSRLVAAVVPGSVDFSGSEPAPGAGSLPFYRHPAALNAAATGVSLGRAVDVNG